MTDKPDGKRSSGERHMDGETVVEPIGEGIEPLSWVENEWYVVINTQIVCVAPRTLPGVITADGFWSDSGKRWVPKSKRAVATLFETREQALAFIEGYWSELSTAAIRELDPRPFPTDIVCE
jgi:hypothetical protein